MNKNLKYAFGLILSMFFATNSYAWTIENFHSDININPDGSANITETITGDFSRDLQKHGIFRYIPFESETDDGRINKTPISQVYITDENGKSRNFQKSNEKNNVFLKIGDANLNVSAKEVYVIKYKINQVPKSFDEHDEFYWNVTGNDWDTSIKNVSAKITLPASSVKQKTACYTGIYDSTAQNCTHSIDENGNAIFAGNQSLNRGEGLTIVYGFDKNIVQTFELEEISPLVKFWNEIGIWILAGIMPLIAISYAWKKKSELKVDKPIIPKYQPPAGIHPTMIGTVIDGKYDKRDFTAGIIDLAVNGLLEIEKKKVKGLIWDSEEYFLKQNPEKSLHNKIRINIYKGLFGSIDRSNSTAFHMFKYYDNMNAMKKGSIEKDSDEFGGIFPYRHKEHMYEIFTKIKKESETKKHFNRYVVFAKNFIFILLFLIPFGLSFLSGFGINSLIIYISLTGAIVLGLIIFPKRTKEGFELAHEAKCYKEFLETAELDQLNWAEKQEIFEKNLPYAIAFDLTDKWASVFGNTIMAPHWMNTGGNINHLSRDISAMSSDLAKNIKSPKSSGGSGFSGGSSGGGSGGGGGGSW